MDENACDQEMQYKQSSQKVESISLMILGSEISNCNMVLNFNKVPSHLIGNCLVIYLIVKTRNLIVLIKIKLGIFFRSQQKYFCGQNDLNCNIFGLIINPETIFFPEFTTNYT